MKTKSPKIMFSIDSYDKFGAIYKKGIYIHFGDFASIKIGEEIGDLRSLIDALKRMEVEIAENIGRR